MSLIALPDTHVDSSRQFLVFLAVCGVFHLLFPWIGIFLLRRNTQGTRRLSYFIAIFSILLSGFLIFISGALLFGIANP